MAQLQQRPLVHLALAACQVIFGGQAVVAKSATQTIPGPLYALFRNLISLPLLYWLARYEKPPPENAVSSGRLLLLGTLAVGINQPFMALGVANLGATATAVLTSLVPLYVALISIGLGEDSFSPSLGGGLACSLAGSLLTMGVLGGGVSAVRAPGAAEGSVPLGAALVIAGTVCYSVAIVLQRRVLAVVPPFWYLSRVYARGAIAIVLLALPYAAAFEAGPAVAAGALWGVLYAGVLTGVVGYGIVSRCAKLVSPVTLSSYALLQPIVAALGANLLLGERPRGAAFLGAALVLAGLALVARHTSARPAPAPGSPAAPLDREARPGKRTPPPSPPDREPPHGVAHARGPGPGRAPPSPSPAGPSRSRPPAPAPAPAPARPAARTTWSRSA
eukprot:tig00001292_g8042.t1